MNTSSADNNFYQMTRKTFAEIQQHNLSKAEWELFLYFSTLDPFGDRYHDYEPAAIMLELGISKATFYRALAKLQDLKLIDSRFTKGQVRNLKGRKAKENQSHTQDKSLTHETRVSPMRQESHAQENEPPEPIQNKDSSSSHTLSYSSDFKEKKKFPKPKKKELEEYDKWYQHAYAQGWVAGRHGGNVTLKVGPLAGCSRHWQEVSENLEFFLKPAEPMKRGFLRAAVKRGLGFGK